MTDVFNILVTGSNSQIASTLQQMPDDSDIVYFFRTREELNILHYKDLEKIVIENEIDLIINLAAYTNVDLAENEKDKAYEINCIGPRNLAKLAVQYDIALIHFSSDYVFDGKKDTYYFENDNTNPINEYGYSKLCGEKEVQKYAERFIILRTSWVYSNFSNNFFNTMLSLSQKKSEINVVEDQFGSPTSAIELCRALDAIIKVGITKENSGIYNFAGLGKTTWKEFATEIFKLSKLPIKVIGILSSDYNSKTERPKNSYLNSDKFTNEFGYSPLHWKMALNETLIKSKIFPIKVGFRSIINGIDYVIASIDWGTEMATLCPVHNMKSKQLLQLKFNQILNDK